MNTKLKKSIEYLKQGKLVLISDSVDRENEYDIAFSARHMTPKLVKLMQQKGGGVICLVFSHERATKLGIKRLRSNGNDFFDTPFGDPLSYKKMTHSAVSIEGKSETIKRLSYKEVEIQDFAIPGHISTLIAKKNGLLDRDGHTEAIIDLLRLAKEPDIGVLCEIQGVNGGMANKKQLEVIFSDYDICEVSIKCIKEHLK